MPGVGYTGGEQTQEANQARYRLLQCFLASTTSYLKSFFKG